ncbi:hypothetical protein DYB31_006983 [Aphanomyces astaci]|uniref:Myb/SANT-like domain-containing protein n=1 Tax=Aphanomyces astaci TaxID=112090 RepID=A0A397EEV8_APHAT|nr:hypothetical protein DYB31_006983 [Aphanomyces astaci]
MAASTKTKTPTKKELIERLARLEAAGQVSNQESSSSPNVPLSDKNKLWTVDMVQVLLELRLRAYGPPFQGSKSNQQLSILWQKIAMRLSIVTGVVVSQTSAKAKYHSLKQEYSRVAQATGNNADEGVEYPAYWEHMVGYLSDNNGLGDNELGSSGDGMENAMVANDGDSWTEPVIVAADDRPSKRQKPGHRFHENEQCGSKSKLINVVARMSSADKSRREDEQRRQESLDREEREREARKREQQHEALMMTFMAKFLGSSN